MTRRASAQEHESGQWSPFDYKVEQQYRFCGDLLLFIAKTSTKNNNNLNYTTHAPVSKILFILIRLTFMFSYWGFPELSAIMNLVYML